MTDLPRGMQNYSAMDNNINNTVDGKKDDKKICKKTKTTKRIFIGFISTLFIVVGVTFLIIFFIDSKEQQIIKLPQPCANNGTNCTFYTHADWNMFLNKFLVEEVERDGVTFNGIKYEAILKDRNLLDVYINFLKTAKLEGLSKNGQLSLLLNAYNAFAIDMVVSNLCGHSQVCSSIRNIPTPLGTSVWSWKKFTIDQTKYSLDDIEHGMIRPTFKDPRIHSAVNCVSISCPNLRKNAYVENTIDIALSNQTKLWLRNPSKGLNTKSNIILLSKIFDWYVDDFKNDYRGGFSHFIKTFGGDNGGEYVNQHGTDIDSWNIEYFDYNWNLNSA